ncbi:MAG: HAMP domain-containing sensor histidine kinase [Oscillospiraceae bacterium]|nr:HAMP domain-containing sensor histidine kinase [Oscillospiraceae bacterium]
MKKGDTTAKRLQRLSRRRIFAMLFFINLALLALAAAAWCYLQESAWAGEYDPAVLLGTIARRVAFERAPAGLPHVRYLLSSPALGQTAVDATGFAFAALACVPVAWLLEGIVVWAFEPLALSDIQSQLKPLYRLAEQTQKLSQERYVPPRQPAQPRAPQNGSLHKLETAIDSLRPGAPGAQLHTDDKDLKGLEDAVNSLLARTRESYAQQTRFVSDASHELRTPIAVIKGYADMLDRWGTKDEKVLGESIAAIRGEAEHMNRLVEQLLFLARGDSGRAQLNFAEFSLSDMMREVYAESSMIDPGHRWAIRADAEVTAYGDAAMLKQAVRVLVDNAVKYTPAGEVILLRAAADETGGPCAVVEDGGIGMRAEDVPRVFERFFRADATRAKSAGGTGLGLSVAKWVADSHGGWFDIVSSEGVGTRFTLHLPKPQEAKRLLGGAQTE